LKKKPISITLENPCHQNWNAMPRQDGGLYCGDCKKVVHDFSIMSDEEIIRILTQKTSKEICGVFRNDQLNRNLIVPQKTHFSLRPLKILLLSLFSLKFVNHATASPHFTPINYFEQKTSTKTSHRISGKATDISTGIAIQNVTVSLVGLSLTTTTDSLGRFELIIPDSIQAETFTLRGSNSGYWIEDYTIAKTQLPAVVNLRMTKVVEIVATQDVEVQSPIKYLGGIEPNITYSGGKTLYMPNHHSGNDSK